MGHRFTEKQAKIVESTTILSDGIPKLPTDTSYFHPIHAYIRSFGSRTFLSGSLEKWDIGLLKNKPKYLTLRLF